MVFMWEQPLHFDAHKTSTSQIEEVMESHIIQVLEAASPEEEEEAQEFSSDIFKVFTTEKKKMGKAPELSAPLPLTQPISPTTNASATSTGNLQPNQ